MTSLRSLVHRPKTWAIGIVALAAALRLHAILSLFPILVDESIYLRWAEIIDHQGEWFVSLLDAKQPLSYWIYAVLRMAFRDTDPLLTARLVSVAAGVISTLLLWVLGRQLADHRAGLVAALLYALFPYAVFYDRLAYTDSLVNMFAIAIAVASVHGFRDRFQLHRTAVVIGLLLGLGVFTKSTVAQFALLPVTAAVLWRRDQLQRAAICVAEACAIAALFPLASYLLVPAAPTFGVNNLLLHHTSFFASPYELAVDPFTAARQNVWLLSDYLTHYVTTAFATVVAASALWLALQRDAILATFAAAAVVPLAFQLLVLYYFPSRYVFPHTWPLLLIAAVALTRACNDRPRVLLAAVVLVATPLVRATSTLLTTPARQLEAVDAAEFLSSGPFSGFGIADAVKYLSRESARGPLVVLTDPIWGPPADAIYPYVNGRSGAHVYDAWWTQLSEDQPILPHGNREIMKSQYQRVSVGTVAFDEVPRVLYVTDTNYNTPADVARREPTAQLIARFPKRNQHDSIDIYRLR